MSGDEQDAPEAAPALIDGLRQANAARIQYLTEQGVQVPMDLLYVTSLLEFVIGPNIGEARQYHELRMAGILDQAVANLGVVQERNRLQEIRNRLVLPGR
jgi:hypothetical protein